MTKGVFTLQRKERLKHLADIRQLFEEGKSIVAFPVRAIYIRKVRAKGAPPARLMVSVPKRMFHHATDRNRVKRQLREAFRHHKHLLQADEGTSTSVALIWIDRQQYDSPTVEKRVVKLLTRISEKP